MERSNIEGKAAERSPENKRAAVRRTTLFITKAAVIAALYVALTYVASLLGLSSGAIQVRFSEALCVLPYFTASAIPGLTIGCLIANIVTGCAVLDVVFGTLATLIGAVISYWLRKRKMIFALIPPILSNTFIVPFVIKFVYLETMAFPLIMLFVFIGEFISAGILGFVFGKVIDRSSPLKKLVGKNG